MSFAPHDDRSLDAIAARHAADEAEVLTELMASSPVDADVRRRAEARAVALIERLRSRGQPGLMERFLAEYGLSTNEGIALMCLAEALLRVPDADTIDSLIDDKLAAHDWHAHLGQSDSAVVNGSTLALMLTGRLLDDDDASSVGALLRRMVKRLGEPVVRLAVQTAMREVGNQFVLGQTIEGALERAGVERRRGFRYSFDMLGEAAITQADADGYFEAYAEAIAAIGADADVSREAESAGRAPLHERPGISVKLSALHPRFEYAKHERLEAELAPRLNALARLARDAGLGLNVDAEEAHRLAPSLKVIERALADDGLSGWEGFGVVVQAYQKRALPVIDWLHALASRLDRRLMVRLVKGAYWDTEIKRAQVDGAAGYPVFTRRAATDVSYLCCAARLLARTDRIYPQFATHNAHTAAVILELAGDREACEFQRLHGMGEALFNELREDGARCRIYAPVGPHKDLLAYLVRRLLENGANSSFVHQVVDPAVSAAALAADPFEHLEDAAPEMVRAAPTAIFQPARAAACGWDLSNSATVQTFHEVRAPFRSTRLRAVPMLASAAEEGAVRTLRDPCRPATVIGEVVEASESDCVRAARAASPWAATVAARAAVLRDAADAYEAHAGELFALLAREAGKTPSDAVAELREAVDFLRYYAAQSARHGDLEPLGVITCISPWNFPLAIFTGQLAAALAAGNAVLAKPAEASPLVAAVAVRLLHEAGVPPAALQLLPGDGTTVGYALTTDKHVDGVCFTGSEATARAISRAMSAHLSPRAPLIAETGGVNAAIVDSTALPEQAVHEVLVSAFQSAGQRCSALRVLYLQEEIADGFLTLLLDAMEELELGDPWLLATDVGPLIDARAQSAVQDYVDEARAAGRLLKQLRSPAQGHFVGPAVIEVSGISEVSREVFGPVLHVARFAAAAFDEVLSAINGHGYGLTFGLHTRIDERVRTISEVLRVGNCYVNRNQIGAVVESQPFGGEGLSGTGPKAGGPNYLRRFLKAPASAPTETAPAGIPLDKAQVQAAIDARRWTAAPLKTRDMPGVTGESNQLSLWPRGLVLCLGPSLGVARRQAAAAKAHGCPTLLLVPGATPEEGLDGQLDPQLLEGLEGFSVAAHDGEETQLRALRQALAARSGPILPLAGVAELGSYCVAERHCCVDTTAAGGNAALLGAEPG